jgi:ribonuclease P protein component
VIADRAATFPRRVRLLAPGQFRDVLAQGRRISAALFRLHVRAPVRSVGMEGGGADAVSIARLGITVSKRVAPLAVQRNRIKRLVRESFRHRRAQLPPADYVLQAQRAAVAATSEAVRVELDVLWRRAGALKPEPAAPTMPARADHGDKSH